MALIGNYSMWMKLPVRRICGSAVAHASGVGVQMNAVPSNFGAPGALRNWSFPNGSEANETMAIPDGYSGDGWFLPVTAGAMLSDGQIAGLGALSSANLAGGLNAVAPLTGSGDITSANLALIVSAVAALTGSGALAADIVGKLSATAALTGSGALTADLEALASMIAGLTGSGATAGDITAKGALSADIVVTGDALSTANVASAVWDVVASSYNIAGTMGELLNNSGAASNPWTTEIETGMTALQAIRIIAAAVAGKVSGGGTTTITFRNAVADGKNRIVATVDDDGNRTAITYDLT